MLPTTYITRLTMEERRALAARCGTTPGHLNNVAYGKQCGIALAVALERETGGQVTRRECRPKDWRNVWPELVGARKAVAA